jgi:hypothetical protein
MALADEDCQESHHIESTHLQRAGKVNISHKALFL